MVSPLCLVCDSTYDCQLEKRVLQGQRAAPEFGQIIKVLLSLLFVRLIAYLGGVSVFFFFFFFFWGGGGKQHSNTSSRHSTLVIRSEKLAPRFNVADIVNIS